MRVFIIVLLLFASACAPRFAAPPAAITSPHLAQKGEFVTRDGDALPTQEWGPRRPEAVIIALHGMNDYANAFADPARALSAAGILTIAYDQRGFGRTATRGIWPGEEVMVRDLDDAVAAARSRYPNVPVFVLGESMGGSVAILWAQRTGGEGVDGVILSAPAVWGWRTLNPVYRVALSLSARVFPSKTFTGSNLKIWPSDNIEMLRALSRDPFVIKATRTDAIYGLVTLMDDAYEAAPKIPDVPVLVLYGQKDQIIPKKPIRRALEARHTIRTRFVYYPHGYHMLLRDLSRAAVTADIAAWIHDPGAPLPSGAEDSALNHLSKD